MPNPLETSSRKLKQFILSQYFSDGVRITLGILLPSIICFHYDYAVQGITLSLGALCVSVPDNPGPVEHRRNAMLITAALIFIMAMVTGMLSHHAWALAILITGSCFLFSMLNVFGARAASVGVSALVIMILGIDQKLTFLQTFEYSMLVLGGGLWYILLSLFSQHLMPYRPAEQTLGECMMQTAEFIRIKAAFYDPHSDIEENYKKLFDQQVYVHQHQDSVRDILFRTRKLLRDTSPTGRRLLLTFVDVVDLYEQTMATHYDYRQIREQFAPYNVLPYYNQIIIQLAEELENIGTHLHNNEHAEPVHQFQDKLALLKRKTDEAEAQGAGIHVLKRILINLRNISGRIQRMYEYQTTPGTLPEHRSKELTRFVEHQIIDWNLFRANISRSSGHFRHAARVALICLAAFIFTQTVSEGPHSYWILLTIIVILKPGFSLTKKRNYERVIGTISGGVIGLLILWFFPGAGARFAFLVVFMLLSYSFIRIRYVVSVLFMTPYILIVFSFTTTYNDVTVTWERIIDTLIGAAAAIGASYFILPSWESYQLRTVITGILEANANYLRSITERSENSVESQSAYRLSRKNLYVQTANLTTAFQRMLSEPKHKQQQADHLYRFVMLNHQLSSYLATLSLQLEQKEQLGPEQVRLLRSTWHVLRETYEKVSGQALASVPDIKEGEPNELITREFLTELNQNATDIKKTALEFRPVEAEM
jgi:YccS/YhfK family integral membrane protein